jgi:AraC-like DNA-binding protein
MHPAAGNLVTQRVTFHSRSEEEVRAFLHAKSFGFDIERSDGAQLDVRIDGFKLPGMYFGHVQYGSPVTLWADQPPSDYWIQIPLRGDFDTVIGRTCITHGSAHAAIVSPAQQSACRIRSGARSARLQIYLNSALLVDQLADLLGYQPETAIEFEPVLDLTRGYGRSLARYVLTAISDLDHADSVLADPATMRAFAEFIMSGLLLSQPNNYSDALRGRNRMVAPRDVKRALDFIEANLDREVGLAEIVRASGVPGRTLFMHFRDCGIGSPMRYVRNARFRRAREALLRARPGQGVFEIATSWGFSHMGRFAAEYRRRFGESPSETLRRRAGAHPG